MTNSFRVNWKRKAEKLEREKTLLRGALKLARAIMEQGGGLDTHVAGNGPTLAEVIREALDNG